MSQATSAPDGPLITEPLVLFDGSFIIEFLEPPASLNSTVLMRTTYKHDHPLIQKESNRSLQAPPFHLHFSQAESFQVLQGQVGTTLDYAFKDRIFTPSDGAYCIDAWVPHRFWPVPGSTEDCVLLVWAHPDNVSEPMDWIFFANLLGYVNDVSENKISMDPFQTMYMQHVTDSALVIFPTATFLGPLRWWIPWIVQAGFASVAKRIGYMQLVEKYTPPAEWEKFKQGLKTD